MLIFAPLRLPDRVRGDGFILHRDAVSLIRKAENDPGPEDSLEEVPFRQQLADRSRSGHDWVRISMVTDKLAGVVSDEVESKRSVALYVPHGKACGDFVMTSFQSQETFGTC